tara:strand:+ start:798 stop:908 length:111 start_codon:yes stop_codon:yes gene_type:complete
MKRIEKIRIAGGLALVVIAIALPLACFIWYTLAFGD